MIYQMVKEFQKDTDDLITHPRDVFNLLKEYRNALQEHFYLITLRSNMKPIGIYTITIGLSNTTIIHPRELFYKAILDYSTEIITHVTQERHYPPY
jgi:DNA repair protein RadC